MDTIENVLRRVVLLLTPLLALVATPAQDCRAAHPCWCYCPCCRHHWFDGTTMCEWRRTWNGPNALATPLNPYFIPRPANCCAYGGCQGGACHGGYNGRCCEAAAGSYAMAENEYLEGEIGYSREPPVLTEPCRLERLGPLPNDVGLSVTLPAGQLGQPSR